MSENDGADARDNELTNAPGTRQRLTRVHSRRARLEAVPGTDPAPDTTTQRSTRRVDSSDDERILRDRPPHWSPS